MGFRKSFPSRGDGMTLTAEGLGQGAGTFQAEGRPVTGAVFPVAFPSVPLSKVTGWDQI